MADPLRLGPWRHLAGVGWSRTFVHCEIDGIQTSSTGWKVWPPVDYEVSPLAHGAETGREGRERADEAARALGWELEGTASPVPDMLAARRAKSSSDTSPGQLGLFGSAR